MHTDTYAHTHTNTDTHISMNTHTYMHTYVHTCKCAHAHTHTHTPANTHINGNNYHLDHLLIEGMIAERYCFKVTLILLALATIKRGEEEEDTIIDVLVEAMSQLTINFQKHEEKSLGTLSV